MLLTVSMLLSALPLSAFAENEILDTEAAEATQEETIDESKIGVEVEIGNDLYTIQEDGLYVSKDFGRDTLLAGGEITWVIERDGALYWSKIEGYNADIYRLNLENGNETILARVFAPATAFDVEGDFVYYLYNGEISKVNVLTGEEVSMGMFDCDGFYALNNSFYLIEKSINEMNKNEKSEIIEESISLMGKTAEDISNDPFFTKDAWLWPIDLKKHPRCNIVTSEYGYYRNKDYDPQWANSKYSKYHQAIDISSESGDVEVLATRDGIVSYVGGNESEIGYNISIEHGTIQGVKVYSTYMHLAKKSHLNVGDPVSMGDPIGYMGSTGGNYPKHLHFQVCCGGRNPKHYTKDELLKNYISTNPSKAIIDSGKIKDKNKRMGDNGAWYEYTETCTYGLNYIFDVNTCPNCAKKKTKDFSYYDDGICSKCHKKPYDYNASRIPKNITMQRNPESQTKYGKLCLRSTPYAYAQSVRETDKFSSLEVVAEVTNADGGAWYEVKYNGETRYVVKYKVENDYYPVPPKGDPSWFKLVKDSNNELKFPKEHLGVGESAGLRGVIESRYEISKITAAIYNTSEKEFLPITVYPKSDTYNTKKEINNYLKFNTLPEGTYYIKYHVEDIYGQKQDFYSYDYSGYYFKVGRVGESPIITHKSVKSGKEVTISCKDSNATIKYSVDKGSEKTISAGKSESFTIKKAGSHTIKAYSVSGGIKSSDTIITIDIPKSKLAQIFEATWKNMATMLDTDIDVNYDEKSAYAIISGEGDLHYTTDGSTPTENSPKYTSPIPLKNSCTVKAISIEYGCAPSDVTSKELIIKEPDPPTVSLKDTKPKIAQGKTATVSWSPVQYATSYHAYLYYNGACVQEIKDIKGTTAAFKLTEVGDYTIKVKAKNFKGLSADSNGVVVSSMAPVWVTFVDRVDINVQDNIDRHVEEEAKKENIIERQIIEGNTLLKQKVDYDEVPVRPAVPSKKGYTFAGWSKEAYEPALTDITVYAEYEINYYTVEFWNYWGGDSDVSKEYTKIIGNPQEIMYSESAVPPTEYYIPPDENYIFAGWSVDNKFSECFDYNFVEGNMRVNTAFTWANMDLPAAVKIDSAKRKNNCEGYEVTLTFVNNNLKDTEARVIVALYTSDNRMVHTQTIEMVMAEFKPGTSDTRKIDLAYKNKISKISAVMVKVTDDKTGGAVSKLVETKNITFPDNTGYYGTWSEWSDTKAPAKEGRQFDKGRVVYSYRDKQYTTKDYANLSGWNRYNTTSSTGSWSGWSQTKVNASTTEALKREVESRYIQPTYKTQYNYWGYKRTSPNTKYHFCSTYYSNLYYIESGWRDSTIPYTSWYSHSGGSYSRQSCTHGDVTEGFYREGSGQPYYYWVNTRSVQTGGGYTEYRYRDTYYTYYFWKWSGWSNWSTTQYTPTGDREVQYKTQYRYRDYFPNFEGYDPSNDNQTEEPTIKTYPFEGTLTGVAADYITEATKNSGSYNVIAGPYYKDDEGNYKLIADNMQTVEKNRYAYYTNGTYGMACKECAEELYGGEWKLEYTEWTTDTPTITENAYSCNNPEHGHMHNSRLEDGTYYWNGYEVNGTTYYHMESNVFDEEITYTDKTKYYLVDRDFEGKKATVLVYKKTNTDPTQEQLQYVDQIDIGANNSYSFTINPKEVLDYEQTGDFIVTLSIEGCMLLNNVGVIKAPVPQYEVKFLDEDAEPITHIDENGEVQEVFMVNEGGGVDVNLIEAPEKEGHRFIKWDKSVVNITKNTTVNAIYEPLEYAVVFVDHENETAELQTLTYGTPITAPNVEPVEGKVFKGWDKLIGVENALVTGSEVITAEWDTIKYTVQFCDLSGNVLERETQEVAYGEAAELPDPIVDGGVVYPWDTTGDTWWNVTHDMTIYPYRYVANDLSAPVADVATGDYDEYLLVNLHAGENSKIYYSTYFEITEEDAERYTELQQQAEAVSLFSTEESTDEETEFEGNEVSDADSMLTEMITEFTEPIPVTSSTVIYAFTVDEDGNISTISSFEYNINEYEPEEEVFVPADDVEQITMPSVVAKPGETVEVPLTLKNNPGVKSLSLILGYDAENLELVSVTNGEVFANSEFSKDTREDGSCKLEWLTTTENTNNGILATLTFKAKENSGEFNIGFDEVTSSDGEEEEYFAVVDGTVANVGKDVLVGDTNGDGEITYADAILLIRHDIGFTSLSDYQKSISDVNGDGEVDFADAIKVLRYDAGFINTLK